MHSPGPCKRVVLGDIDEFNSVECAGLIGGVGTCCFITGAQQYKHEDVRGGLNTETYPNEEPSSPCSYVIFSWSGSLIVSAPISNIWSTSASTPWFLRLQRGPIDDDMRTMR